MIKVHVFFLQDMLLLHFDAAKSHLPRCLICLEEFADGDELKTSLGVVKFNLWTPSNIGFLVKGLRYV